MGSDNRNGPRTTLLGFLRDLRDHNERTWFAANRARYDGARGQFEALVGMLIDRFDAVDDLGGVSAGECVFRINRDVRFSRDKSPYKTAMGALLGRSGRRSGVRSYYLHVEPDGLSFLAGGLYEPTPAELERVRAAIVDDPAPLRAVLADPDHVRFFGPLRGESLKTAPRGYPKDHPAIDFLRLKRYVASHPLSDDAVASDGLVSHALEVYTAMKPFLLWLESALA